MVKPSITTAILIFLSFSFSIARCHRGEESDASPNILFERHLVKGDIFGSEEDDATSQKNNGLRGVNGQTKENDFIEDAIDTANFLLNYIAEQKNDNIGLSSEKKKVLAKRFAPIVYLHPMDTNRPDSIDTYLKMVTLRDKDGNVLVENPTPDDLVDERYNKKDNFLKFKRPTPTGIDAHHTGKPIVQQSADSNIDTGFCTAPVYVNVQGAGDDVLRITYAFFYPFNGPQTLRAGYAKSWFHGVQKRNFPLSPFARHEGDFETVTVFVKKSTEVMLGVYISQHGDASFSYSPPEQRNGRPVIYSALNSHANYFKVETKELDGIVGSEWGWLTNSIYGSGIRWSKAVDTTELYGTVTYNKPMPYFEKVLWDTQKYVVLVEDNAYVKKSLSFLGYYGDKKTDNSSIEYPPSGLPGSMRSDIYDLTVTAKSIGQIPANFLKGNGPRGPYFRKWWVEKQPLPGDLVQWSISDIVVEQNRRKTVFSYGGIELQYYSQSQFEILVGFGGRVDDKSRFTRLLLAFFHLRTGVRRYQVVGSGTTDKGYYEKYVEVNNGFAIVGFAAAVDNNNLASVTAYYQKIDPTNVNGNYLIGKIMKKTVGNGKEEVKYVPIDAMSTIPLIGIGISAKKDAVDGMRIWAAPFKRV